MTSNLSLNPTRLQVLHAHYVVHSAVFKMKEKFTQMLLSYSAQARSLRQTLISYDMKMLGYARQCCMKRRDGSVEKRCIYTKRVKMKVKGAFSALQRWRELESASPPQKRRSVNTRLPHKIKSFK